MRGQKVYLPPTLDRKRADQLKDEQVEQKRDDHERNNGNADDEKVRDFNPEYMPNITKMKSASIPREAWNENVGFSVSNLSPPTSNGEAFKSLSLLLATHSRHTYVDLLLPPVDQPRQTELQWFVFFCSNISFSFLSINKNICGRNSKKLFALALNHTSFQVSTRTANFGRYKEGICEQIFH